MSKSVVRSLRERLVMLEEFCEAYRQCTMPAEVQSMWRIAVEENDEQTRRAALVTIAEALFPHERLGLRTDK